MSFDNMRSVPGLAHFLGWPNLTSGGATADNLNGAYVYGTSGQSYGYCMPVPPNATQLTDVYVFPGTLNGTGANIKIRFEVRNMSTSVAGKPDTTLYGAEDFQVFSTALRWYRLQFATPVALPAAGTPIGILWGNVSASPGTDFLGIHRVGMQSLSGLFAGGASIYRIGTSNGYTTSLSPFGITPTVIMKFDDGTILGTSRIHVGANWTNFASNQRERGLYIPASGYDQKVNVAVFPASTTLQGLKIYKASTAPGSTPGAGELSLTFTGFERINGIAFIQPSFTFLANQAYRAVLTFNSNTSQPTYVSQPDVGRYTDVDNANWLCDPLSPYCTIDNGAGGWTDMPEAMPRLGFVLENWPALASGGSAGIITHPGMLGI